MTGAGVARPGVGEGVRLGGEWAVGGGGGGGEGAPGVRVEIGWGVRTPAPASGVAVAEESPEHAANTRSPSKDMTAILNLVI